MKSISIPVAFSKLLEQAVNEPGIISRAYSQFHNYSFGNMLLAVVQCSSREIPLGPMATYKRWQELGRQVRKGEKAITLCQPVTIKNRDQSSDGDPEFLIRFTYRPRWFVLAQTEGKQLSPVEAPDWDRTRALALLGIAEVPFRLPDGNVMGYARHREIAINPMNQMPHKTTFHECAHVLLGHTAVADHADAELLPRSLAEVEAEAVALLCCEALGLPGAEHCRGYIQTWNDGDTPIPEQSARRIMTVADQLVQAGRPSAAPDAAAEGVA